MKKHIPIILVGIIAITSLAIGVKDMFAPEILGGRTRIRLFQQATWTTDMIPQTDSTLDIGNTDERVAEIWTDTVTSTISVHAAEFCVGSNDCFTSTSGFGGGSGVSDWLSSSDETYLYPSTTRGILATASSSIEGNFRVDGNSTTTGKMYVAEQIKLDNNLLTEHASLKFLDLQTMPNGSSTILRIKAPINPYSHASEEATLTLMNDIDGDNTGVNEEFVDFYNERYDDSFTWGMRQIYTGTGTCKPFQLGHWDSVSGKDAGNKIISQCSGTVFVGSGVALPASTPAELTSALHVASSTASYIFLAEDGTPGSDTTPFSIDGGGKVGIGDKDPTTRLHVQGTSTDTVWANHPIDVTVSLQNSNGVDSNWFNIINRSADDTASAGITFQNYDHTNHYASVNVESRGASGYKRIATFRDNALGLSTTTPGGTYGEVLTITGNGYVEGNATTSGAFSIGELSVNNAYWFPTTGPGGTKVLKSDSNGILTWQDDATGGGSAGTATTTADYTMYQLGGTNYLINATGTALTNNADAQTVMQFAVDNMDKAGSGGILHIFPGTYYLNATTTIEGNNDTNEPPHVTIRGAGTDSTIFIVNDGVDGFELEDEASATLKDFTIYVKGNSHGIVSDNTGTTGRAFWMSEIKNLHILATTTHTGWGMNLEDPFRSVIQNIEMFEVGNCLRVYATDASTENNPGDILVSRVYCEQKGDNGIAYEVDADDEAYPMHMHYDIVEALSSSNNVTGFRLASDGSTGPSQNVFDRINLEQFDYIIDVQKGNGNYFDLEFTQPSDNGTVFRAASAGEALNNYFRGSFIYVHDNYTVDVIDDSNTDTDSPNHFYDSYLGVETGATASASTSDATIIENIAGYDLGIRTDFPYRDMVDLFGGRMVLDQDKNSFLDASSTDEVLFYLGGNETFSIGTVGATTTGSMWITGDARVVGTLDSSDLTFTNPKTGKTIMTMKEDGQDLVWLNIKDKEIMRLTQDGRLIARGETKTNYWSWLGLLGLLGFIPIKKIKKLWQ